MLLFRVCLGLAIAAGIGVIVLSQVVLKPQIQGIIDLRQTHSNSWVKAEGEKKKLNKELTETQTKLKKTEGDLADAKTALANTAEQLTAANKRIIDLTAVGEKLKADLKAANDALAAWKALGYTVEQIAGVIKERNDFKLLLDALKEENVLFTKKIKQQQDEIENLRGTGIDPPMPPLRGKVLVVDPKWDFIVLDVGSSVGVKDRGVLLVSRNGALIAKVRVMNLQPNRSIANIMPGWKLKDVMEGDQVFPYAPSNTF